MSIISISRWFNSTDSQPCKMNSGLGMIERSLWTFATAIRTIIMSSLVFMVMGWPVWFFKHIGYHVWSPKAVFANRVHESCVVNVKLFSTIGCPPRVYNAPACVSSTACVWPNHVWITLPRVHPMMHVHAPKMQTCRCTRRRICVHSCIIICKLTLFDEHN